ncbi:hypothetical protein SAMN05428995_1132 [Loktanella sp. DSM 29012]|nr:hypothetical protein SAMN05428995_1132 [Loktanella sp. DSM 29012]
MSRARKDIAGRKGSADAAAPATRAIDSAPTPLVSDAIRSQSMSQFHDLLKSMARELARRDHAADLRDQRE